MESSLPPKNPSVNTPPDTPKIQRPKFQFSLRTMLLLTGVVAALCSAVFAGPTWLRIFLAFFPLWGWPAALIAAIVYSRGYPRVFCIAALSPCVLSNLAICLMIGYFSVGMTPSGISYEMGSTELLCCWAFFSALFGLSVCCGLLGILAKWVVIAEKPVRDLVQET